MDTTIGSILQVALNERNNSSNIYANVAVNYNTYNFENYRLTLSRNADKIIPEYLIMELYDHNTPLDTIYNYGRNIYINFQFGNQTILNIPLSILWNLKEPEICGNKLYLHIPFEMFFGNINIVGLPFRLIMLNLVNYEHLFNYVRDYSLMCKTYIGDIQYRRNNTDTSNCCIQQVSSIEVRPSLNNNEIEADEFRIKTTFEGFTKGFFIESNNVDDLYDLRFYLNGQIRFNYNSFMIRNKCQKINNNMIFFPFNNEVSFLERNFNSYVGSINLSAITEPVLSLKFCNPRTRVKIYSINMNTYSQRNSGIMGLQNIPNNHVQVDFNTNSVLQTEETQTNIININAYNTNIVNNYNPYLSYTSSSNYIIDNISSIENIIINAEISRLIPEDRRTCGINLEEIQINQRYMYCSHCLNNFNEQSIRTWLQDRRTCPTCRGIWSDFNIYINF
jgi:hypothetical protein